MECPKAVYGLKKRVRVICPECGAGGANSGPCYCYCCDYKVVMLPASGKNWEEELKLNV